MSNLSATYFEVADNSDTDFNSYSKPNVAANSALGANGLPVATTPYGVTDINAGTNEITWWSPLLNRHVAQTGTGTISLPYASNMFAPGSTGTTDKDFFETALFKGNFTLSNPGTVQFQLGSDDDSFIYVDGILFGQNPGIHTVSNVSFTSPTLAAGSHALEVFYDDRQNVAAYLSLNLQSSDVVITPTPSVPEPATWMMMLGGFGIVGYAMRKYTRRAVSYG